MSHGHHLHHTQDAGHTHQINPTPVKTEAELAAEAKAAEKEASKLAAQKKRDEKKAEAQAKRDAKAAERESKNAEKEAERVAKAESREAEKATKAAERAAEAEKEKAAKKEEREAAKVAKKAERDAARETAKAQKVADKAAAKQAKSDEVKARAEALEARKAETKVAGERRSKATHVLLNAAGLSNPQTTSIRGKVLEHLRENYEVGDVIPIDTLAKDCKPLLYGASVRSFLSKLEEVGHIDFTTLSAEEAGDTDPEAVRSFMSKLNK